MNNTHVSPLFGSLCVRPTCLMLVALVAAGAMVSTSHAQIYVSSENLGGVYNGTLDEFNMDGSYNQNLAAGLYAPAQVTVTNGAVYVGDASNPGTVGQASNGGFNGSFVTGLTGVTAAVAGIGNTLYVADYTTGTIGTYDATTGAAINASLITGLNGTVSLAISNGELFALNLGTGTVSSYTLAGALVNSNLVTFTSGTTGMAVSGNTLYLDSSNGVGEFDATTGSAINASLVTGLGGDQVSGLAVSGGDLYVIENALGQVGEYDAVTGAVVNAALITGLSNPAGIAIGTAGVSPVPEPLWAGVAALLPIAAVVWIRQRRAAALCPVKV